MALQTIKCLSHNVLQIDVEEVLRQNAALSDTNCLLEPICHIIPDSYSTLRFLVQILNQIDQLGMDSIVV